MPNNLPPYSYFVLNSIVLLLNEENIPISYLWYEVDCLAVEASTVSELSLDLHVVEDV